MHLTPIRTRTLTRTLSLTLTLTLPLSVILILTLALTRIAIQDDAEMFAVVCQHLEQVLCDLGQALKHHQNRDDILRRIGDILTQASASSPSPLALTLAP